MSVSISKIEVFLALTLIFGLSGCGKTEGVYVGHYYDGNETITLNANGTYRQVFYYKGQLLYDRTNLWSKVENEITFHQFHCIEERFELENGLSHRHPLDFIFAHSFSSITNERGDYIYPPYENFEGQIYSFGKGGRIRFGGIEIYNELEKVK
jgi:hypothetical protein